MIDEESLLLLLCYINMKNMKMKVLVTGKNRKIAGDVCDHLEKDRGYFTINCPPEKADLEDIKKAGLPQVIIICMQNETEEAILNYDVFADALKEGSCTIVVVANQMDETFFVKYSALNKVSFLSRPVPFFALYEILNKVEKGKKGGDASSGSTRIRPARDEDSPDGIRRKHILVVDDDPEQLSNIKEQLREFYEVTLVKSGEDAFRFLEKRLPDLILLDYMMPDMSGPQVLRRMKMIDDYMNIPVVFLTGNSERSSVIDTLTELRPAGYLIKPSKKSEIVAKIIDVLG